MDLPLKLEIYGIIIAVAILAALGWGWHEHSKGVDEERGRWEVKAAAATRADLADLQTAIATANTIAQTTADTLAKRKTNSVIDRGVIEREIRTDVRYVNDCMPDTGRLQWNAILQNGTVLPSGGTDSKPIERVPVGDGKADTGQQRWNPVAQRSGNSGLIRQLP